MYGPTSVRVKGELERHVEGFWAELMRLGYSPLSARNHLRLAAHLGRWLASRRLGLHELDERRASAFLRHRQRIGYTGLFTDRGLAPLLGFLRRTGAIPAPPAVVDDSPAGAFLDEYAKYLVRERGLAGSTVRAYADFARRFIGEERPRLDWRQMTAADVARFVMRTARRSRPPTCKLTVTALRALLRFLHVRGAIALDLASGVPTVASWRLSGLPRAIEPSQVVRILASFDGSPAGLRGAAIVRLLVRLGLRAAEVGALDIDDVDWSAGEIVVRGKGRCDSRLPLPPDVGEALAAYLRRGRPRASGRALFLRDRAPFTRLRPGAVCHVARTALASAGVNGGAHRFRHTAATQLLRRGASLSEIAHVLRHRSADTTAIYAKVDLATLADVTRRWPGGAA